MTSTPTVQIAAMALFVVALLFSHEMAHVAIARLHGYPMVCLGVSPLAVGVVFLDEPAAVYWLLQTVVPMVVTALVTYLGLFVLPPTASLTYLLFPPEQLWQGGFCLVLALLTSSGDLMAMATEMRKPLRGRERVTRDIRLLRQIRSLIWFTDFGRRYLATEFGQSPRDFVTT